MPDVQREQRGRSMDVRDRPEEKFRGMTLPCIGRERAALSVTDGCRWPDGDGTSMRLRVLESVVNIAHFRNYRSREEKKRPWRREVALKAS